MLKNKYFVIHRTRKHCQIKKSGLYEGKILRILKINLKEQKINYLIK